MNVDVFKVGSSTYKILPEFGFRLMSWSLETAAGIREVLYWPADTPDDQANFGDIRGGNPILFPFSGRSFDRGVQNVWRAPSGKRLPMPMHGFARDSLFEVEERTEDSIRGRLVPSAAANEAYPYDYTMRASYKFEELAISAVLSLQNHSAEPIPWSAGHHFYFTLPWHARAQRGDYRLNLDARKHACHGPDGKLVMFRDRESCHDFSDTALSDRIHWQLRHNRISFGPKGGEEDLHVIIGQDAVPQKGFTIVTWSESAAAPFYCIEPWMGPPNAAEHGKGLHWVHPGDEQSFSVQVSLY